MGMRIRLILNRGPALIASFNLMGNVVRAVRPTADASVDSGRVPGVRRAWVRCRGAWARVALGYVHPGQTGIRSRSGGGGHRRHCWQVFALVAYKVCYVTSQHCLISATIAPSARPSARRPRVLGHPPTHVNKHSFFQGHHPRLGKRARGPAASNAFPSLQNQKKGRVNYFTINIEL